MITILEVLICLSIMLGIPVCLALGALEMHINTKALKKRHH